MLLYDALDMTFTTIKVRKNPACPVCGVPREQIELIDYEQFCGMPAHDRSLYQTEEAQLDFDMRSINVQELAERLAAGEHPLILDVRDPHEWEIVALDGTLRIPKGDILAAKNALVAQRKLREETVLAQIPQDQEIIVHCRSGKRSADVIAYLREVGYDTDRLFNLEGGILAWANEIDTRLPTY
jgi:adenylyltransferase/sulfurtransferase